MSTTDTGRVKSPPVDPRLLTYSPASRVYIVVTALLCLGLVLFILTQHTSPY